MSECRHGRPECMCQMPRHIADVCCHGSKVCECGISGYFYIPDLRFCEPCGYFGITRDATTTRGMDNAPVCAWHASGSWSSQARCAVPIKVKVVVDRICDGELPCSKHEPCEHPYPSRAWMWDGGYHCYECDTIVEDEDV